MNNIQSNNTNNETNNNIKNYEKKLVEEDIFNSSNKIKCYENCKNIKKNDFEKGNEKEIEDFFDLDMVYDNELSDNEIFHDELKKGNNLLGQKRSNDKCISQIRSTKDYDVKIDQTKELVIHEKEEIDSDEDLNDENNLGNKNIKNHLPKSGLKSDKKDLKLKIIKNALIEYDENIENNK